MRQRNELRRLLHKCPTAEERVGTGARNWLAGRATSDRMSVTEVGRMEATADLPRRRTPF
jgi:hypothetical protein